MNTDGPTLHACYIYTSLRGGACRCGNIEFGDDYYLVCCAHLLGASIITTVDDGEDDDKKKSLDYIQHMKPQYP